MVIGNELTEEDGVSVVINRHIQYIVHTGFNQFRRVKRIISNIEEFPFVSIFSNEYIMFQNARKKIILFDSKPIKGKVYMNYQNAIQYDYFENLIWPISCGYVGYLYNIWHPWDFFQIRK